MKSSLFRQSNRKKLDLGRMALAGALALAMLLCMSPVIKATPVTFQFEAEVDQVAGSADGLVQVEIGDTIHGSFTYEPAPLGSEGTQNNELRFEVNGLVLSSVVYDLFFRDNAGGTAWTSGRYCDDTVLTFWRKCL